MKNRKKVISFILTLMLLFGLVPMGLPSVVDEVYAGLLSFDQAFTSVGGIYQIRTAEELTSLSTLVKYGRTTAGLSFEITGTGINLSEINWTPIGTSTYAFSGTFYGNNLTISGVTFSTSAAVTEFFNQGTGFFGVTSGASIQNLNLVGVSISAVNCKNVGGLAGYAKNTTISGVVVTGTVAGLENVGGLIGNNQSGNIEESHTNVVVTGDHYVGGLVGENESGNIEKSYANGIVTGKGGYIGGLVGDNCGLSILGITDSYATGNVIGTDPINSYYVGGLVGWAKDSDITSSYATGNVTGNYGVGGLVGGVGTINVTSSYAIGLITGTGSDPLVGGLVGQNYENRTTIAGCFWDTSTSGITTEAIGFGTGRNTTDMTSDSSIYTGAGWDFTTTWVMGLGEYKYPIFRYSLIEDTSEDPNEEVPPVTHHHHTVVVEPVMNILRFNIGNVDSFLTLGSSLEERRLMDVSPILFENRTLLPIRFVVEPLGGTIIWNEAEQKVTITRGETTIELWIGNNVAKVNGIDKVIDPDNALVKPMIVNPGRTMLPLRFISEALGCTVDWNEVNQEILVTNW